MHPALVVALWALWCLWLPVQTLAFVLDDAEKAINVGRAADVISAVQAYQPTTEQETLRRLWILGVANARAGRVDEAIAPLAELVALMPAQPAFRLELTSALLAAGQTERARYHLEQVRNADLRPEVRDRVDAQIVRLDRPKHWLGYFRMAFIPESNAARQTQAETVNLGGLSFNLTPAAREQAANGVELGFGLAAVPPLSARLHARFGLDVNARLFDGNAPNDVILRAHTGLIDFNADGRRLLVEIYATQRWIDETHYSRSHGLGLTYGKTLGNRARIDLAAQHEKLTYVQGRYDTKQTAAQAQLSYAVSPRWVLRTGLRLETRSSQYAPAAGFARGLTLGGDYTFANGLRLGLDLSYDLNDFRGVHPLFGVARSDRKASSTIQLTNQKWNFQGFAPVFKVRAEHQTSNIVLNSYRNLGASIGFTRSF
ncbi:porin family protein [Sulfitobacter brevis]|nr:porin family protein [Sulfitobacter brevis]